MGLLVVEDNARLALSLVRGLREDGFDAEAVSTGEAALRRIERRDVDAFILDLGLPDFDGTEVLRAIRGSGSFAPVLVLTARDAVASRIGALEQGADDYVIKPFVFAELLARVRALLRRAAAPRWAPLTSEGIVLNPGELSVVVDGRTVALSPRQHAFLELLLRRRGETLPREVILKEVFGYGFDPGTNLIDVHVGHLRKRLGAAGNRIQTVRGVGYRLRPVTHD